MKLGFAYPILPMKFPYILLLGLLLLADIFAFTEVAALLRKPSDTAVMLGLGLLALLAVVNFFIIRYSLSKLDA
ncbi:hypothetical protein GCM10023188_47820 [Pontibacter saemangeumensis]|uniref:Uncharacterized protein n=2 Tax=Pontibacter saemangeumensis TaxID=1084525 RepID=A0ABP8M6P8_9BACT